MATRKKKKKSGIFDAIKKPVAPPARQIGQKQPLEKRLPSGRKSKHKKALEDPDGNF